MSNRSMNCRNCVYSECVSSVYWCRHDKEDAYMIRGNNPPCEDYVRSLLPAYKDRWKVIPRRMGIQWG